MEGAQANTPAVLGEGVDPEFGIHWELAVRPVDEDGRAEVELRYADTWARGRFPLRRRGSLQGDRVDGPADRSRGIWFMLGTVGDEYDRVFAEHEDGTRTDAAAVIRVHHLPCRLYVLFVGQKPTRVVATTPFAGGAGQWIDRPLHRPGR